MSQLQPFTVPASINPCGVKVRTHGDRRNPLFCLADVCQVLDIANVGNVAARLDDDEKGIRLADTPGGRQEMVFVNESGFYAVILRSDKPQAQPFRRWVTKEVLPSIREYGCYPPPAGGTRAVSLDEVLEAAIARHVAPLLARIEELERPESLVRRMAGVERQLEQGVMFAGQAGNGRKPGPKASGPKSADQMTGRVQQAVLSALRGAGPDGLTCQEIADATGEKVDSVRKTASRARAVGYVTRHRRRWRLAGGE